MVVHVGRVHFSRLALRLQHSARRAFGPTSAQSLDDVLAVFFYISYFWLLNIFEHLDFLSTIQSFLKLFQHFLAFLHFWTFVGILNFSEKCFTYLNIFEQTPEAFKPPYIPMTFCGCYTDQCTLILWVLDCVWLTDEHRGSNSPSPTQDIPRRIC